MEKYQDECRSCVQFQDQDDPGVAILARGEVVVDEETVKWVVIESAGKSVSRGSHLLLTTSSHHIGAQDIEVRAALTAEVVRWAGAEYGEDYRLVTNAGVRASTMTHYHAHIIVPGENEKLPRIVANIPKEIEALVDSGDISQEVVGNLLDSIMQR